MATLGRNRKLILSKFMSLEQRRIRITFEAAKEVLKEILDPAKLRVDDKNWHLLIKFAEKDGIIDFKLLMDTLRDRNNKALSAPKAKIIYI